jgi:hypothetical protein
MPVVGALACTTGTVLDGKALGPLAEAVSDGLAAGALVVVVVVDAQDTANSSDKRASALYMADFIRNEYRTVLVPANFINCL